MSKAFDLMVYTLATLLAILTVLVTFGVVALINMIDIKGTILGLM